MTMEEDFYEFSYTYPYSDEVEAGLVLEGTVIVNVDVEWREQNSQYEVTTYVTSTGNVEYDDIPLEREDEFKAQLRSDLSAQGVDLNDVELCVSAKLN